MYTMNPFHSQNFHSRWKEINSINVLNLITYGAEVLKFICCISGDEKPSSKWCKRLIGKRAKFLWEKYYGINHNRRVWYHHVISPAQLTSCMLFQNEFGACFVCIKFQWNGNMCMIWMEYCRQINNIEQCMEKCGRLHVEVIAAFGAENMKFCVLYT